MTTIAYRDRVMAADSIVTYAGSYVGSSTKAFRNDEGNLLGVCGAFHDLERLRAWFLTEPELMCPPDLKDAESEGLLVDVTGGVFCLQGKVCAPIEAPFHAVGSGFQIAMGAMAAGATAEEAVRIACRYDLKTREPITVLRLG